VEVVAQVVAIVVVAAEATALVGINVPADTITPVALGSHGIGPIIITGPIHYGASQHAAVS
jgi:hypothetical protein